jgi:cyclic pyranopterin phosphate synthase
MTLSDSFGRKINYLRLSVTDRCNLRCSYCMPAEGVSSLPHSAILDYEKLLLVARAAIGIGIEKVRVTGGEPLVRKGIVPFLARLAELPGLARLALTTNGLLLEEMAESLHDAGVRGLNISLDSLRPDRFTAITRGGDLSRVMAGIAAAERAGFTHPKINMVVMRGVNDDEVVAFAAQTLDRPCTVRFIEQMPTRGEKGWQAMAVPGEELLERIARRYPLTPLEHGAYAGPAREYRIDGAAGIIGFITPLSGHFCGSCNRIRVRSTGMARGCLFSAEEIDLRPLLKAGDLPGLEAALRRVVCFKPDRHPLDREDGESRPVAMSRVGG